MADSHYKSILFETTDCDTWDTSFGVYDSKGREIGARITTQTAEFVAGPENRIYYDIAPGVHYAVCMQATRNTLKFGASQPTQYFTSRDQRFDAIVSYLKSARARAKTQGRKV